MVQPNSSRKPNGPILNLVVWCKVVVHCCRTCILQSYKDNGLTQHARYTHYLPWLSYPHLTTFTDDIPSLVENALPAAESIPPAGQLEFILIFLCSVQDLSAIFHAFKPDQCSKTHFFCCGFVCCHYSKLQYWSKRVLFFFAWCTRCFTLLQDCLQPDPVCFLGGGALC